MVIKKGSQANAHALAEEKEILSTLQHGELTLQGQFIYGSNYTFLVQVAGDQTFQAVYKPSRGERPLWDFPEGTLAKREVAAYRFSQALGWHLVPPTIYRLDGPADEGSLQLFIDHDPGRHYFTLTPAEKRQLKRVALFDLMVNNADRKGGHLLYSKPDGRLWLIDHGLSFHCEPKLRTVIWDFIGKPIPVTLLIDIDRLLTCLKDHAQAYADLVEMIDNEEVEALMARMATIVASPFFSAPSPDLPPYPWPPV